MTPAGQPRHGTGREVAVVLGVTVLAAGLLVVAAGRPWATAVSEAQGMPTTAWQLTGQDVAPAVFGLGLAGLAGALGVLATRGRVRRAAGAVVALCGAGAAVAAGLGARTSAVVDALPPVFAAADEQVTVTGWPVAAATAAVVVACCGVLIVWRGARWPAMGARYDAPSQHDTEPDMWRALDRGDDPTA